MKGATKVLMMATMVFAVAGIATADHSWATRHWARQSNPLNLALGTNLPSAWGLHLSSASVDWDASSVVDTTIVPGNGSRNCQPTKGRVEVCDGAGRSTWLRPGLAPRRSYRASHCQSLLTHLVGDSMWCAKKLVTLSASIIRTKTHQTRISVVVWITQRIRTASYTTRKQTIDQTSTTMSSSKQFMLTPIRLIPHFLWAMRRPPRVASLRIQVSGAGAYDRMPVAEQLSMNSI